MAVASESVYFVSFLGLCVYSLFVLLRMSLLFLNGEWNEGKALIEKFSIKYNEVSKKPFFLVVSYTYEYGGESYRSKSVNFSDYFIIFSNYSDRMRAVIEASFREGVRIPVYINSKNPRKAVLEMEKLRGLIIALMLIVFTTAILLWNVYGEIPDDSDIVSLTFMSIFLAGLLGVGERVANTAMHKD